MTNYIISARTAQGYEHWKSSSLEERLDIVNRWQQHKDEFQNVKQKVHESGPDGQESGRLSPKGFFQTRHLSFEERKKLHEERLNKRQQEKSKAPSRNQFHGSGGSTSQIASPPHISAETHEEFEHAIKASVASTSRGNPDEDAMIERAIRASVRELQSASSSTLTEQEALDRAIQASIREAGKNISSSSEIVPDSYDAEHDEILQRSLQESLYNTQTSHTDDLEVGSDDDEDIKRAIEDSKTSRPMTEEEIVLEYVKKQSLAEEEHRKAMQGKQKAPTGGADDEDDQLKRAIEESMKAA